MKTRKNKGGAFFSDNKYKTCDNNKKDWRKNWEKFRDKQNNRPYALYNSSYLYPGSMNLRGAVPTQGNLLNEQGNPRDCPESPIKSCEDNKYDWQNYWSSNPEYSGFIPTHLYPSDANLRPIPNGLKTPDGKPCIKAEFTQYVNSRAYDKANKEFRNQPEQLNQQIEEQWQKVDLTRDTTPKQMPELYYKQSQTSITKEAAIRRDQQIREKETIKRQEGEQQMELSRIKILQHQLRKVENSPLLIKVILGSLKKQETTHNSKLFGRIKDSLHIEPINQLSEQLDISKIKEIIGFKMYDKVLSELFNYDYLGNLTIPEVVELIGIHEFNRIMLQPSVNTYGKQLRQEKQQIMATRKNFVPAILDDEPDETQYEEIVSIIVSHNTRIQCLLDGIQQNQSEDKVRFMNCAILKLELTPERVKLSMVYQGELSDKEAGKINNEKPYYVQELSTKPGHIQYPTFIKEYDTIKPIMKLPDIIKKYTFYIIRHGQAEHNVKNMMGVSSTLGMKLDTSITDLGRQQAENAGKYLKDYLMDLKMPTRFFVSDLVRTYQTLDSILNVMGIFESVPDNIVTPTNDLWSKPIVLPCANELPIKGNLGQCDKATADAPSRQKMARENDTKCVLRPDGTLSDCNPKVDWHTLYFPFYQYVSQRVQEDTASNLMSVNTCQDSNMIAMALLYLMNENVKLMTRDEKIKLINAYITSNKSKLDGGRRTRKLKLKRNIKRNRTRK
jgi:broad specificity phosphatase PhoE